MNEDPCQTVRLATDHTLGVTAADPDGPGVGGGEMPGGRDALLVLAIVLDHVELIQDQLDAMGRLNVLQGRLNGQVREYLAALEFRSDLLAEAIGFKIKRYGPRLADLPESGVSPIRIPPATPC